MAFGDDADENDEISDDGGERHPCARIQAALGKDFFGKPASTLDFTFIAPPVGGTLPASDQVRAIYTAGEKDKKLTLARQAQDLYMKVDSLPYPQMMELEGFLVECNDGNEWVRTWDTVLNSTLPKAVRVTLMVKDGEKTVNFSTTTKLWMGN
ncbi:MAG: type II secretion system protein GspJ [Geobacteraceae bacterium]